MRTAPVLQNESGARREEDNRQLSSTPCPAEHPERLIKTLTVIADWKDDLCKQQARMLLCEELVGVDQHEIDELKAEFDKLAKCMRALSWRPDEVQP
jgi:hypothetical protein